MTAWGWNMLHVSGSLLILASMLAWSSTDASQVARRQPFPDPLFEREPWPFAELPLNLEPWMDKIRSAIHDINGRIKKFRQNIAYLKLHHPDDTPENWDLWWRQLSGHGFRLANAFDRLRHRLFVAYAFYLSNGDSALAGLLDIRPLLALCEAKYVKSVESVRGSLGERVILGSGLSERFPLIEGNVVLATWGEHMRPVKASDIILCQLKDPRAIKEMTHLSELLYWREAAATRREHSRRFPCSPALQPHEEEQSPSQRDQLIEEKIRSLEAKGIEQLARCSVKEMRILVAMADMYVTAFEQRADQLEFAPASRRVVSDVYILQEELVFRKIFSEPAKTSSEAVLAKIKAHVRRLEAELLKSTMCFLAILRSLGHQSGGARRRVDMSEERIRDNVLKFRKATQKLLEYMLWLRNFRRNPTDPPLELLVRVWASVGGQAPPPANGGRGGLLLLLNGQPDPIEVELVQLVRQRSAGWGGNWAQPTTFGQILELASEIALALRKRPIVAKEVESKGELGNAYSEAVVFLEMADT